MTLQKYDYVQERASKLAAGALLLALYMKNLRSLVTPVGVEREGEGTGGCGEH